METDWEHEYYKLDEHHNEMVHVTRCFFVILVAYFFTMNLLS